MMTNGPRLFREKNSQKYEKATGKDPPTLRGGEEGWGWGGGGGVGGGGGGGEYFHVQKTYSATTCSVHTFLNKSKNKIP